MSPSQRLPPSPPPSPKPSTAAEAVLDALRNVSRGRLPSPPPRRDQYSFHLPAAAWNILQTRLHDEPQLLAWFDAHARYDYTPHTDDTFVLRMPDKVHEDFITQFNSHVEHEILPKINAIAGISSRVRLGGSRSLSFAQEEHAEDEDAEDRVADQDGDETREQNHHETHGSAHMSRNPDSSIVYGDHKWPALVAEVSYSQQCRALPHLADDYLLDSDFHIRCVLAFNIPSRQQRLRKRPEADMTAVVFLWRPGENAQGESISEAHLNAVPFRSPSGAACDGELSLTLADLVPESVYEKQTCPTFTISFAQLCNWLDSAERKQIVPHKPRLPRKRRRDATPEEVLDHERESKFVKQEQDANALSEERDGSWKARVRTGESSMVVTRSTRQNPTENFQVR